MFILNCVKKKVNYILCQIPIFHLTPSKKGNIDYMYQKSFVGSKSLQPMLTRKHATWYGLIKYFKIVKTGKIQFCLKYLIQNIAKKAKKSKPLEYSKICLYGRTLDLSRFAILRSNRELRENI